MIAPQPFYTERGTPMNIKTMCQILCDAKYHIDLLTFPTGRDVLQKNLTIIRLPNILRVDTIPIGLSYSKFVYDILIAFMALLLLITKRYDVVHGIEEGGYLAVFLSKLFKKNSIFDMDSSIPDHLQDRGLTKIGFFMALISGIEKWCLKNSTLIITVCEALSDKVRQVYPKATIYQIEDIPLSNPNKKGNTDIEDIKRQYNLKKFYRVVYTGNLESYQGIDLLINAWKLFSNRITNFNQYKLVIVGGTADKIEHYNKIAVSLSIQDSVCWVGQRPSEEMDEWMGIAHALVSPRIEGDNTPLKLYSYMASGKPIIATRRRTHTQILDDSLAFLAEPTPIEFGMAISDALNDFGLASKKANNAKRVVETKYNFRTFQRKLLKAYKQFIIVDSMRNN